MKTPYRRRILPWVLVIAFVVVPLVEIAVVIQVGQVIGALWTVLLLIVDSLIGAWLVKREGKRAWRAFTDAFHEARMPATEIADGALILIGGTLLLTPGFVTDAVGLALVLPFTRPIARRALAEVVSRRLAMAGPMGRMGPTGPMGPHGPQRPSGTTNPGPGASDDSVIRGEVVDD